MAANNPNLASEATPVKLYRSNSDKIISGVCGGLAAYLKVDVLLVRCVWFALVFFGGIGLLPYILAWFIVPENPNEVENTKSKSRSNSSLIFGIILMAIGVLFLVDQFNWFEFYPFHYRWDWDPWWLVDFGSDFALPLLAILIGVIFLVRSTKKEQAKEVTETGASNMEKKLTRSTSDKMISGVCGGLAVYFKIDSSFTRIAFAFFTLAGGGFLGLAIYIIMIVVVPEDDSVTETETVSTPQPETEKKPTAKPAARKKTATVKKKNE